MQRLRSWRHWRWVRDVALALLLVLGIRTYQQRDMPKGSVPLLTGSDLNGEPVSLADYRGKPLLLHFWATWCGVCKAEQHNIDAVARDLPVLSVASQSGGTREIAAFVREHGVAPRVVVDEESVLARRFGVHAFPATFVIDADGAIRHAEVGYTTELGLRARMWLAGL
ncbi:MAG TPA: protein disulfide oxidoreductase [Polyangiaceae bacterium]|nr:protein disulfide oxidoreductase [Polyangiaceae bacterium]